MSQVGKELIRKLKKEIHLKESLQEYSDFMNQNYKEFAYIRLALLYDTFFSNTPLSIIISCKCIGIGNVVVTLFFFLNNPIISNSYLFLKFKFTETTVIIVGLQKFLSFHSIYSNWVKRYACKFKFIEIIIS